MNQSDLFYLILLEYVSSAAIILPNQLFKDIQAGFNKSEIFLTEESLFFSHYKFHQQKILFHRTSMRSYENFLRKKDHSVTYIESSDKRSDIRNLIKWLNANKVDHLQIIDPVDDWLSDRIRLETTALGIKLTVFENPSFLEDQKSLTAWFSERKNYFQTDFYIRQRKRLNILLDNHGAPLHGKWTFDAENRLKYPKNQKPPRLPASAKSEYTAEAVHYLQHNYVGNPGASEGAVQYSITHASAEKWLQDFLQHRFRDFGAYEDAIVSGENVLHHSLLSPLMNAGLLTPDQVVRQALDAADEFQIPINSLEGFIRQIIGWREFIRGVYLMQGRKQRTTNYWGWTRQMPASFYTATTGIRPVDDAIQKVLSTGYNHHIERLMVIGNFMLLSEIHPDQVYQWFMEMYIDAYDWVMVPNVYGMSQFADGGLMCTKPYISGSNYILKMSDYSNKEPWTEIWDALFWRFMDRQRSFFLKNPRMGMLIRTFDKMDSKRKKQLRSTADQYLEKL